MALSANFIRTQLNMFKPFVADCSLETTRKGQDALGNLMVASHRMDVSIQNYSFDNFEGAWVNPKKKLKDSIILYLHGGGYTCGDLEYAKGFSTILAAKCNLTVFCAAYRLAPEAKFPAALDDAFDAYLYLLQCGYSNEKIILCGESAGGGLIYSLCLKLKEKNMPLPCGLIAISPWTDLTASGNSYKENKAADPSMTLEKLSFFADCYTDNRKDPLVSPLFGDLSAMPSSLIFVGGDEIMLDDAQLMHQKLLKNKCESTLIVAPDMWHGYLLYSLKERLKDFDTINEFINKVSPLTADPKWLRLDNAAKLYPAVGGRNWTNVFRLSANLNERIDKDILRSALQVTIKRFPSIAVRVRKGMFWYYLEPIKKAPKLYPEKSYPVSGLPLSDIRKCAFRVIAYKKRIAVECFHALTDGNGALVFLKTLVAEYLTQRYGENIPPVNGVLDRSKPATIDELEDSFLKYSGNVSYGRKEPTAYHLSGTPVRNKRLRNTAFMIDAEQVHSKAKEYGVSVTGFICAALVSAINNIQKNNIISPKRYKPVRILIPVDLRRIFGSKTLRNFVLYVTPGIDPRLGDYDFEEICKIIHHTMGMEITKKQMAAKISKNVNSEKSFIVKILPLFIKNLAIKAVFNAIGEKASCLSLSNLGTVTLPDEMQKYVERMDFVLGIQKKAPYNCGMISYNGTLYINFIRNIKEPELEFAFYNVLKELGIKVKVESNQK